MIKIIYQIKGNNISKIIINGHAKYDDYGKDIVCAAVSSIAISTINGLLSINNKSITYTDESNLEINNILNDDVTNKLLLNMLNMFTELESSYPQNIKIRKEEL